MANQQSMLNSGASYPVKITKRLEVRLPDTRTQSDRRRLGSVTLARSRVRVRAGYEFVSYRHHPIEIKGSQVR